MSEMLDSRTTDVDDAPDPKKSGPKPLSKLTAKDIKVGRKYKARVSNKEVVVRVEEIFDSYMGKPRYTVKNLTTGKLLTFKLVSQFRDKA